MITSIQEAAEYIISKLKNAGVKIQRYDSMSTSSIYLKLDYGVANSIRISDHYGKKHLQYRYNLLSNYKGPYQCKGERGLDRFYYTFDDIDILLDDVWKYRQERLNKYGETRYKDFMESNRRDNSNKSGFWAQCFEV